MKKTIIFITVLCLGFILLQSKSYARVEDLPIGRNYLDLSTFFEIGNDPNKYQSHTEFKINNGSTYTLVMSKQAVLTWYDEMDGDLEADIEMVTTANPMSLPYQKDILNERVYIEFKPSDDYIAFEILHLDAANFVAPYEVILYEGTYEDFFGFEPYLNPNDNLKYHGQININYDQLLSTETISSYITAQTPDGLAISKIISHDTYSASDKLPGAYELIYESTYNNITKQFILSVLVEDLTAPVLSIEEPIRVPLSNKVDVNTLKSKITIHDNVDEIPYQNLIISNDTYTSATTVGMYQITVDVSDSSSNQVSQIFDIELYDNQGPTISGPSQLYLYVGDEPLSDDDILDFYQVTDDVGVRTSSIIISHDEYNLKKEPGKYLMTISASDTSNNVSTKDIYIHVIDNRGPEFNINPDYIITINPSEPLSDEDIIQWLTNTLEKEGVKPTNMSINHNEYALRSDQSGQYYVYMSYQVEDDIFQTRVLMDVVEDDPFYKNPIYLLTLVPILLGAGYIIYRKRKHKI